MQHSRLSRVLKLSSISLQAQLLFLEFLFRFLISTYVTSNKIPWVSVSLIFPLQNGQEMTLCSASAVYWILTKYTVLFLSFPRSSQKKSFQSFSIETRTESVLLILSTEADERGTEDMARGKV